MQMIHPTSHCQITAGESNVMTIGASVEPFFLNEYQWCNSVINSFFVSIAVFHQAQKMIVKILMKITIKVTVN